MAVKSYRRALLMLLAAGVFLVPNACSLAVEPQEPAGVAATASDARLSNQEQRQLHVTSNASRRAPLQTSRTPSRYAPSRNQGVYRNRGLNLRRSGQPQRRPSSQATRQAARQAAPAQSPDWVGTLLTAHQVSTAATTDAQFTQVVRLANTGLEQGATGESRVYAKELASWGYNRRGESLVREGQSKLAEADFTAALQANPNNWRALHNRGVSAAQAGDFLAAFEDITRVLELNPNFAKAYANRATLYSEAGNANLALADYQNALTLDGQLVAAHVGIARVLHSTGDLSAALGHLDAALSLDSTNAEVFCSRADLHSDLGHYEKSLDDYAQAVELNPKFAHAYRNGAWLLATCPDARFRDQVNAIEGAKQALEFDYGERHIALDTLAAAYANASRFEEAVGVVQQAIKIAPVDSVKSYEKRLRLYLAGKPFRTKPILTSQPGMHGQAGDIQQADFRE